MMNQELTLLADVVAELMILGFISLLLTIGQNYIAKICIPSKAADTMLPCSLKKTHVEGDRRRLLWDDFFSDSGLERRVLAGAGNDSKCGTVSASSYFTLAQAHARTYMCIHNHYHISLVCMFMISCATHIEGLPADLILQCWRIDVKKYPMFQRKTIFNRKKGLKPNQIETLATCT